MKRKFEDTFLFNAIKTLKDRWVGLCWYSAMLTLPLLLISLIAILILSPIIDLIDATICMFFED
jgi:hypothetical protein